jgi:uncharacterized protein YceK
VKNLFLALSLSTIILSGCSSQRSPDEPPRFAIVSIAGSTQAGRDIAAGKLQLMEAGGYAVYAPGIPENNARFARLPRKRLPNGCTNPNEDWWFEYAKAYNAVVVAHVQKPKSR